MCETPERKIKAFKEHWFLVIVLLGNNGKGRSIITLINFLRSPRVSILKNLQTEVTVFEFIGICTVTFCNKISSHSVTNLHKFRISSNKRPRRLFQNRSWKTVLTRMGVLIPILTGKTKIAMLNDFTID